MTLSMKENLTSGPLLKDIVHALNKIDKKDEFKKRLKEKDEKEREKLGLRRRHPVKTIIDLS